MGIGVSIFLLAVGAILAFAVNASVNGLDLQVVGFILMAAGPARHRAVPGGVRPAQPAQHRGRGHDGRTATAGVRDRDVY